MRRFASMVRLPKPDWKRISEVAVWGVFCLFFLILPIIKRMADPEIRKNAFKMPTEERYKAVIDSAFALSNRARDSDMSYTPEEYAHDMIWLRNRGLEVARRNLVQDVPFDGIIRGLHDLAVRAQRRRLAAGFEAKGQKPFMADRMATPGAEQDINDACTNYARTHGENLKPIDGKEILAFFRHLALSNFWAMMVTILILFLRLIYLGRLKEELLLSPGRFLWSCFFWGYGISNYPGNDVASEIRFARLRQKRIRNLDRWHLTSQEEAALWLMARDRLIKFDEAIETVRDLGIYALARPRRTFVTTALIWLTSGSLNVRNTAAETTVIVEACQLAQLPVPELQLSITPFTPMGGGDKLSPGPNAFLPCLISLVVMHLVCLGAMTLIVDRRKLMRTIRAKDCRAPPVISGGTR